MQEKTEGLPCCLNFGDMLQEMLRSEYTTALKPRRPSSGIVKLFESGMRFSDEFRAISKKQKTIVNLRDAAGRKSLQHPRAYLLGYFQLAGGYGNI